MINCIGGVFKREKLGIICRFLFLVNGWMVVDNNRKRNIWRGKDLEGKFEDIEFNMFIIVYYGYVDIFYW